MRRSSRRALKGWSDLREPSVEILKRYFADGVPLGCASDRPNDDRRKILCELIDQLDGEIWSDWDNKQLSKDEAKEYVTNYSKAQVSHA